jgi:hypothetical protein
VTEQEARYRAEAARSTHEIDEGWRLVAAERRYILVAGPDLEEPAPVRDLLAWIVRFGAGISWTEVALDDRTGAIVRVERSR